MTQRKCSQLFTKALFLITSAVALLGCGATDFAEQKLPQKSETCGGAAVQTRYLVFFEDGTWELKQHTDREKFKADFVAPNVSRIKFIEYDQRVSVQDFSPDPRVFSDAETMNWGAAVTAADSAWRDGHTGDGVIVAVVDSGVSITHPQLANQIAFNKGEVGRDSAGNDRSTNGVDDDDNGFVDDYAGYDFISKTSTASDPDTHGTHVAGIIAAEHSDTTIRPDIVQGVAPRAKILPLKFLDGQNGGYLSDAIRAIDYAAARGAKVINASWGGPGCSRSLQQKVTEVGERNILFIAAAGNSGANLDRYPEYPAAFNLPLQITVGSIGSTLLKADHSNFSEHLVHIFSPGVRITSTIPGGYASFSGTSMATPFVSGAAAILFGAHPEKSAAEIRAALLTGVSTDPNYYNASRGRLNIPAALSALQ